MQPLTIGVYEVVFILQTDLEVILCRSEKKRFAQDAEYDTVTRKEELAARLLSRRS